MSPGRRSVVPHVVDAVGLTAFLLAAVSVIGVLQNRATPVLPATLASSTLFAVGYLLAHHHQERLHEQLADAYRDPLTGLPTRATARDVLASAPVAGCGSPSRSSMSTACGPSTTGSGMPPVTST